MKRWKIQNCFHKISDSVYSMNHIGGYNVFLGYYNKLLKKCDTSPDIFLRRCFA